MVCGRSDSRVKLIHIHLVIVVNITGKPQVHRHVETDAERCFGIFTSQIDLRPIPTMQTKKSFTTASLTLRVLCNQI